MKITVISDTHSLHQQFSQLEGDVLIHCGDMFNLWDKDPSQITELDEWFSQQKFDLILCTGGNHDHALEDYIRQNANPFKHAVFLQDASYQYKGVNFYGAPWVPDLSSHAFYQSSRDLVTKWSKIPVETDVLITHTPPSGILDRSSRGLELGCEFLSRELIRVAPKLHCFGHVHASPGMLKQGRTTYINASSVNSQIELVRKPLVFEI